MRFPRPFRGGRPPADYRADRPEVGAPRGAREPTGTNGPTLTNTSTTNVYTVWLTDTIKCSSPLCGSQPTQPPHAGGQSEYWLTNLVVVIAAGKRPASIPNLEAKPASADGTAPGRVWESRTPPQQPSQYSGSPETCKTVSGLPLSLHDASKQPLEARPRTNRPLSQQPFYFSDKVGA